MANPLDMIEEGIINNDMEKVKAGYSAITGKVFDKPKPKPKPKSKPKTKVKKQSNGLAIISTDIPKDTKYAKASEVTDTVFVNQFNPKDYDVPVEEFDKKITSKIKLTQRREPVEVKEFIKTTCFVCSNTFDCYISDYKGESKTDDGMKNICYKCIRNKIRR